GRGDCRRVEARLECRGHGYVGRHVPPPAAPTLPRRLRIWAEDTRPDPSDAPRAGSRSERKVAGRRCRAYRIRRPSPHVPGCEIDGRRTAANAAIPIAPRSHVAKGAKRSTPLPSGSMTVA